MPRSLEPMNRPVLLLALGLTGCVGAINAKEAQMHFEAAHQYDIAGDYLSARDQYWKALVNARLVFGCRRTA